MQISNSEFKTLLISLCTYFSGLFKKSKYIITDILKYKKSYLLEQKIIILKFEWTLCYSKDLTEVWKGVFSAYLLMLVF